MAVDRPALTRGKAAPHAYDERIRIQAQARVSYCAAHPWLVEERLRELDREWSVERWLQLKSSILSLAGLILGATRSRRWLALPAVVQGFLLQHGVQGWCPPVVLLREFGVRTVGEIETERQALKALRGDFAGVGGPGREELALRAATQEEPGTVRRRFFKPGVRRVPDNTSRRSNERLRHALEERLVLYAGHPQLRARRIARLSREWDVERVIEVEGPLTSLTGLALALRGSRKWLALPLFAQAMVLLHSIQGFHPLLPLLRRIGLRTEQEIAAERYALKALRGDFAQVPPPGADAPPGKRADRAFEAAQPDHARGKSRHHAPARHA